MEQLRMCINPIYFSQIIHYLNTGLKDEHFLMIFSFVGKFLTSYKENTFIGNTLEKELKIV